jgi:hypothetical protein
MLLGMLLVLLLGDAAWIGYTAAHAMREARDQIRRGRRIDPGLFPTLWWRPTSV